MQEAHSVLLNKHYEIPFEKKYAMGFPLSYSITNATGYIKEKGPSQRIVLSYGGR